MSETRKAGSRARTGVLGTGTVADAAEYDTVSMALVGAVAAAENVTVTARRTA